ncbi:Uncharacterised protein [Orientia tsutsugamushi]|uniref:Uncharacterized protein n=1 Tax=Orientia tsutsugamushi TaxID=784 RepID=A0A2U3QXU4_ORITS|nr:Uncharacterised protein [Orientia tsutsugamushi]
MVINKLYHNLNFLYTPIPDKNWKRSKLNYNFFEFSYHDAKTNLKLHISGVNE